MDVRELAQALKDAGVKAVVVAPDEEPEGADLSLYLPSDVPDDFYYNGPVLRSLTRVDSGVFRRLLGIK